MAQYHDKAEKLQEKIYKASFTPEQMQTINEIMHCCTMLRQGAVIDSVFECLFKNVKVRYENIEGYNGKTYKKLIVEGENI